MKTSDFPSHTIFCIYVGVSQFCIFNHVKYYKFSIRYFLFPIDFDCIVVIVVGISSPLNMIYTNAVVDVLNWKI